MRTEAHEGWEAAERGERGCASLSKNTSVGSGRRVSELLFSSTLYSKVTYLSRQFVVGGVCACLRAQQTANCCALVEDKLQ